MGQPEQSSAQQQHRGDCEQWQLQREVARGEQTHLPLRHLPEALLKQAEARFIEGAHGLGQIPATQQSPDDSLSTCHITTALVCVAMP